MPITLSRQDMRREHIGFVGKRIEKQYIEAMNLFEDIFEHDPDKGAKTTLALGIPGSGKTTIDLHIAENYLKNHANDLLFWRSAFSAPLQFLKLSSWHIYIQEGSGVRIYNRTTRTDETHVFENNRWITYFPDIPTLIQMAKEKRGVVNAVFFKDLHKKGVQEGADQGTLMWFQFLRYLMEDDEWNAVFLDEAQEMAAVGSAEQMWYEIREHSKDLSNARKCLTAIHSNCHQTGEIDYRVVANYQMLIQCYGSRLFQHSPVNKMALQNIPKPNPRKGLVAWLSSGNRFGKFIIRKVYTVPRGMSYIAKIDTTHEKGVNEDGKRKPGRPKLDGIKRTGLIKKGGNPLIGRTTSPFWDYGGKAEDSGEARTEDDPDDVQRDGSGVRRADEHDNEASDGTDNK